MTIDARGRIPIPRGLGQINSRGEISLPQRNAHCRHTLMSCTVRHVHVRLDRTAQGTWPREQRTLPSLGTLNVCGLLSCAAGCGRDARAAAPAHRVDESRLPGGRHEALTCGQACLSAAEYSAGCARRPPCIHPSSRSRGRMMADGHLRSGPTGSGGRRSAL